LARDATALPGQEDTPALDLHEPETWRDAQVPRHPLIFVDGCYRTERLPPVLGWGAVYEPMRKVKRIEPLLDRYREISHPVTLKNGGRKVWRIARSLDGSRPMPNQFPDGILETWLLWASQIKVLDDPYLPLRSRHGIFHSRLVIDGPIHIVFMAGDLPAWATLDIKTRDLPVGKHVNELHSGGVSFILRGLPVAGCNGKAPPSLKQDWGKIETRLAESKWSHGPMCNPERSIALPPSRQGPQRVIHPFTKLGWYRLGPLRRATAKDWAEWKRNKPEDYAAFFPVR
jgi:hypothetical protein